MTCRRRIGWLLIVAVLALLSPLAHAQSITPGAATTVLTAAQRIAALGMFVPDGNMGAFSHSGTNYVFAPDGGARNTIGFTVSDLNNWTSGVAQITTTMNIPLGGAGSFDQNYAGGGATYYDAADNLLIGMYHGEFWYNPPGDGSVFYAGLGLAYSNDLGATWHKLGQVISPQTTRASNCQVDTGVGTLVPVGIYLYAYYVDEGSGCNGGDFNIAVARATITSVVAAAMAGTPFTSGAGTLFMKYTGGGSWTGNGVTDLANPAAGGGAFSPLTTGNQFFTPNVAFNTFISRYVLCYSNLFASIDCALSTDGLAWGTPVTMVGGGGVPPAGIFYPTLLNASGGDPESLGQNFFVYYVDPFGNWSNTALKRVAVTAVGGGGGGGCGTPSWINIIDCTRAAPWTRSAVGVPGGIPSTWTQCGATIAPYGSPMSMPPGSPPTTINNAIAACGNNQYVLLGNGDFWLNGGIDYSVKASGRVAVKGSSPNNVDLHFFAGVSCYNGSADVCMFNANGISGGSGVVQPGGTHAFGWTAGYAQGATSITVNAVGSAGISNGDMIVLDQANDAADNGGEVICDQNGAFLCLTEMSGYVGRTIGGIDYQQEQVVKVISGCPCSGAGPFTLTISPGLYANNWNGTGATGGFFVEPAPLMGLEGVTIDDTPDTCGGSCSNIIFVDIDGGWIKNVRSIQGGRAHVRSSLSSHLEIRDSYFIGTKGSATQSYGWELGGTSDSLIENNICQQIASCNIGPGASSGNVFAYNFAINDLYVPQPSFLQVPYFAHDAGNSFNLYEGNQFPSLACDATHGNSALDTAFRNRLNGRDYNTAGGPGNQPTVDTQALSFNSYCRGYNVIGNVLGTPGYHVNYQAHPTGFNTTDTATGAFCNAAIYDIGSSYGICRGAQNPCCTGSPQVLNDPVAFSSMMRWGNYDTANGGVRWDATESSPPAVTHIGAQTTPASHALPASLYFTGTPAWYNVVAGVQPPLPAVGPDVSGGTGPGGFSYNIPAANCYYNVMGGPTDGGGGVLGFDSGNCYGGAGAPIFSASPASFDFGGVTVGLSSATQVFTISNGDGGTLTTTPPITNVGGNTTDFVQVATTCAGTTPCTVTMRFTPSAAGSRTTNVTVVDNATGSPHHITVTGTGVAIVTSPPTPPTGLAGVPF